MDKEKNDLELKKLKIEKAKVFEGILRTLFFVLVADLGGTLTLILNYQKYNTTVLTALVGLGILTNLGLIFSIAKVLLLIKENTEV